MTTPCLYTRDAFNAQGPIWSGRAIPLDNQRNNTVDAGMSLFIDAGIGHIRFLTFDRNSAVVGDATFPSNSDLPDLLSRQSVHQRFGVNSDAPIYISGKLAPLVREALGCGKVFLSSAASWLAAHDLLTRDENDSAQSLAIVELSASGYLVVGVDRSGALKDDLLVVNPRCGAGSGVNLDRVLQKLGLKREEVDQILEKYAGDAGREARENISERADRCGVFSSSATISDKNQGIPLETALATTLKSEVLKACRKVTSGFDQVCLTGRVFHWRFARECAEDYLGMLGVKEVVCDPDNTLVLKALRGLITRLGNDGIVQPDTRLMHRDDAQTYPAFSKLKERYQTEQLYLRLNDDIRQGELSALAGRSVDFGLDVGSTMAKVLVIDTETGEVLAVRAYSNSGDTIETIKQLFSDLRSAGIESLAIRGVGITGSARYQVQQALERIYPELSGRVSVLVENYAHARGSIALAREHVQRLKAQGVEGVNEDFCVLVDIGGEDTKISTIALREAELFNNAMNLKCSAGTGSLMDTLAGMFGLPGVADACADAYQAPQGHAINATCAVFLMENASKLQAQGVPRSEILASANWAVVENMARTLWSQVELPRNAVVLLHGQTMLSEPLPVAVTHRLQTFLDAPSYALVPPNPGHRACFGLVRTLEQTAPQDAARIETSRFLESSFDKRIIQCRGVACGDDSAVCNRTKLTCRKQSEDGAKPLSFTLGGCSAINELVAKKKNQSSGANESVRDTYKEIWDFIDRHQPRSEEPNRLVIPRSFCVSEWAYLFARLFERLGLPVHVDNVHESDLTAAQPLFNVDSCAPHMGAVGQFRRLAEQPHGMILAPQIEFLPTEGKSLGRTCTLNQGGIAVAMNMARLNQAEARMHLFNIDLSVLDAETIRSQLHDCLEPVFRHYGIHPNREVLHAAIAGAIEDHIKLRAQTADFAADLMEEALANDIPVALVVGREYILNPGIYDSHVRRLLREKRMVALPSYLLDLELNEEYSHLYWRNPHGIVTILDAVSRRTLHQRLRHLRLSELFQRIESGPDLLPVVQISTFSCGPDSTIQPLIAEIMKHRPFLLIQSDAVIQELAHLENRVNTYVKQLELGLHERLKIDGDQPFDISTLDEISQSGPINRDTDVICFPTMSDNRMLTAVLRGAGYTCLDTYQDGHDLEQLIKQGRRSAGDAICAPLAGVYADLERAVEAFHKHRTSGDQQYEGKKRLLYFDNKGTGPCRQGQYMHVHQLLYYGKHTSDSSCSALPGQGVLKLLVGQESDGYNVGIEEWALARAHQGIVLEGVLHSLLFKGGTACRDFEEYKRFLADYRLLKRELFVTLENFRGPGPIMQKLISRFGGISYLGPALKYFAYRLHGRDIAKPLRRFAKSWIKNRTPHKNVLKVAMTGEAYMRVAQSEDVFRLLLANLGFRRFSLDFSPAWSYMEWLCEEEVAVQDDKLKRLEAAASRDATQIANVRTQIRTMRMLRYSMRNLVARRLYRAAEVSLPLSAVTAVHKAKKILPTLRPLGEIGPYVGEVVTELRHGADVVFNIAPNGCMVASMGEVLTPVIQQAGGTHGRVQHLFSADGDVNEELLTLALLKTMGPENYYRAAHTGSMVNEEWPDNSYEGKLAAVNTY
jgi:activator of 2-hydroxyglutaryl-CoA dehydratase/predicted nucleotide-binding protein (sugar kinase/HSP70/actin superfamily)